MFVAPCLPPAPLSVSSSVVDSAASACSLINQVLVALLLMENMHVNPPQGVALISFYIAFVVIYCVFFGEDLD